MDEFALIRRWFSRIGTGAGVITGVGDDAAVVTVPYGEQLVVATDTLVADVHFPLAEPAAAVGYRAVAVNISDFAAMAATPRWFTLALTLPTVDTAWLNEFAAGLTAAAATNELSLVGGDTTRGPLTISLQMLGSAPPADLRRRSGAQPGDALLVSGSCGDAAAGLALLLAESRRDDADAKALIERFRHPPSRWSLARRVAADVHAAIDVSDGLLADLGHLADASGVAAIVDVDAVPRSAALQHVVDEEQAVQLALTGGDDYELIIAAPRAAVTRLEDEGFSVIGHVVEGKGVTLTGTLRQYVTAPPGYRHFRDAAG